MKLRYPLAEPPRACEHMHEPAVLRSALRVAHYDLDNGYTVSILRVDTGGTAELWEAWAWPTALGSRYALTERPTYHESAVDALLYRNEVVGMPDLRLAADELDTQLRRELRHAAEAR